MSAGASPSPGLLGLHDLSDEEFRERYPVDMGLVARAALAGMQRRWHIEFDAEGATFIWDGAADSETEAVALAWKAIYWEGIYDVEKARIVICLERRS